MLFLVFLVVPAPRPFAFRPGAPGRARQRAADARDRLRRAADQGHGVRASPPAIAGLAGGLFAQANAFVTLDVLSFARSGTVLIVLILGGVGRLYGAFLGATVYYLLEDQLAKISPEFWQFGVGLVLVLAVLFARGGLLGLLDAAAAPWRRAP